MIAQRTSMWAEGFNAGASGAPMRCPAAAGSVESWSWHSGYLEGRSSQKKTGFTFQIDQAKKLAAIS
jgi:hypothetical protein